MKNRLNAILFDMGSTLIEFENSSWEVLRRLCAENGYRFLQEKSLIDLDSYIFYKTIEEEFEIARGKSNKTLKEIRFERFAALIFKKLRLHISDGNFPLFLEAYYQPITEQLTLIDGALEILKYFEDKNLEIGLVSNTIFPERFHLKELKKFGICPFLDLTLFSSSVGYKKPHPKIFKRALNKLRVKPEEAVFVGDRLVEDIGGAQDVGMKAILKPKIGRDYSTPIIPDSRINDLRELPGKISEFFEI
jgi:HAD superfamily hydrolase (TIGR01549 family)